MNIRILEETASGKVREQTPEEAEKFMARIRTNLFDLLCHSDKARAELPVGIELNEYGGKEAVERAIGKAIVNLFALAAVFGVKAHSVILGELGFASEADRSNKSPGGSGRSTHLSESERGAGDLDGKAGSGDEHQKPAPASEVNGDNGEPLNYRRLLEKAGSAEERNAIWKKIQVDRSLDSGTRAELYQHMTALNKKQAA